MTYSKIWGQIFKRQNQSENITCCWLHQIDKLFVFKSKFWVQVAFILEWLQTYLKLSYQTWQQARAEVPKLFEPATHSKLVLIIHDALSKSLFISLLNICISLFSFLLPIRWFCSVSNAIFSISISISPLFCLFLLFSAVPSHFSLSILS